MLAPAMISCRLRLPILASLIIALSILGADLRELVKAWVSLKAGSKPFTCKRWHVIYGSTILLSAIKCDSPFKVPERTTLIGFRKALSQEDGGIVNLRSSKIECLFGCKQSI